ncbi:MAG TPA: hypothetical protein VD908_19515 [Cytophagales bacterium]|nr:hypothetical protein [Cytophagales bacterium]
MNIDKLDLTSPDLVNENFRKLAALFSSCVTKKAIAEGTKERYRLDWSSKKAPIAFAIIPTNKARLQILNSLNLYQ